MSDAPVPVMKRAQAGDAPAVRQLTRDAYAKWVPLLGREPKPMTADYDEAVQRHQIDLLYVGPDLAALIELIRQPDHLLIENVAVSPRFQGRGLGRSLLAHAEVVAASMGLRPYISIPISALQRIWRSMPASAIGWI